MRIHTLLKNCIIAYLAFTFVSCTDEKETLTLDEKAENYLPLAPGKYITYRLDSLTFSAYGTVNDTTKYQVKHVIDSKITDNLGRPSYRVYRFIRDSVNATSWTPAQPWTNAGTYYITPLADQVELIEDNLRFIKLHNPVRDGFSWKGNKYLPANPYHPLFAFTNDDGMGEWDFYYDGSLSSYSYKGKTYTDVISVEEEDEAINVPIVSPNNYAAKTRAVEKYSKNIGLVFRQYEMWDYQNTAGGSYAKTGFGITMWMIDHN